MLIQQRLLLSFLCFKCNVPIVHAQHRLPESSNLSLQENTLGIPQHAPPEPWDDHICQALGLHPDFYLTFSWGEPISPTRIYITIEDAKARLHSLIDLGDGAYPLPSPDFLISNLRSVETSIEARRFRKNPVVQYEIFTLNQALAAVELFELCGLATRNNKEMWAYVFARRRQVGYIHMERKLDVGEGAAE